METRRCIIINNHSRYYNETYTIFETYFNDRKSIYDIAYSIRQVEYVIKKFNKNFVQKNDNKKDISR